jgi:hypothetical protein
MTWKMATSFVLTAETWLGAEIARSGEEALLAIGVSHRERLGLVQRITGHEPVRELAVIFGENGELAAERLS